MMLTPEGQPAGKIDKIMLLAMWAKRIREEATDGNTTPIIAAGMGRPTYPLNKHTQEFLARFWSTHSGEAIGYGNPQGDDEARTIMARAMTGWYETTIDAKHILFTVGGAGSLKSIFSALKTINADTPNFRVITPFPYYTLYADNDLKLHPINVMQNKGYHLTANSLEESIKSASALAEIDNGHPRAVLICDPNNPLGTVLGREELERIAIVLRKYPKMHIILDEAYAEMVLSGDKHISLLNVAPDLKDRITIMRSATKGLSAAGERMAITMSFNAHFMNTVLKHNISSQGHAPRSLQVAYATTMDKFNDSDRRAAIDYYRPKIEYVTRRLAEMGAMMPDKEYKAQGTFYALGDFSDLLGSTLSEETHRALNKRGKITSDEDITYSLLFQDKVMIAPLSYFGMPKNKGHMRITCSGSEEELEQLMNRLEARLKKARQEKLAQLKTQLGNITSKIDTKHRELIETIGAELAVEPDSCVSLKQQNEKLKKLLFSAQLVIKKDTKEGKNEAATTIQKNFRGFLGRKKTKEIALNLDKEWNKFLNTIATGPVKTYLQTLGIVERLEFQPWRDHLKLINKPPISAGFFMRIAQCPTTRVLGAVLILAGIAALIVGSCGIGSIPVALMLIGGLAALSGTLVLGFFSKTPQTPVLENGLSEQRKPI